MKLAFSTGSDPAFVYPVRSCVGIVSYLCSLYGVGLQFGHTALHRAGEFGNKEVAEMLLLAGADLMAVNQVGEAPLDCAKRGGHVQTSSIMTAAVSFVSMLYSLAEYAAYRRKQLLREHQS